MSTSNDVFALMAREIAKLTADRDALLQALRAYIYWHEGDVGDGPTLPEVMQMVNAAIAQAESK